MKKGTKSTMIKKLCAGLALGVAVAASPVNAQDADGLQNLARAKKVKYSLVDESGQAVNAAKHKDPKSVNLTDGKRADSSIAKSDWGANKAKEMRIRFDFSKSVSPQKMKIIWLLWKSKMHWIDRVKVFIGDDVDSMKEVKVTDVKWAPERSIPIELELPKAKGRYLDLVIEQDAHPEHKMFTIAEVEIYGSAKDRNKLDK